MSFSLLSRRLIGRAAATPAVPSLFRVPLTRFGSHHAPAGANAGLYDGFDIHPPKKRLVIEAKVWGAIAWFWIFYQLHNNWDVMLVRFIVAIVVSIPSIVHH
jgi:hypothetical protein